MSILTDMVEDYLDEIKDCQAEIDRLEDKLAAYKGRLVEIKGILRDMGVKHDA